MQTNPNSDYHPYIIYNSYHEVKLKISQGNINYANNCKVMNLKS